MLCLDIHEEKIVALALASSGGGVRVTGCVEADTLEQSFASAVLHIGNVLGDIKGECRITIGAECCSFRNVSLPFSDRKKIEQVLPMELAEQTPVAVDSLVLEYTVAGTGPQGVDLLVVMIDRTFLAERISVLRTAGCEPVSIGLSGMDIVGSLLDKGEKDFILLDVDAWWAILLLVVRGRVVTIRSLRRKPDEEQASLDQNLDLFVRQTLLACRFYELQSGDCPVYQTGPISPLPSLEGFVVKRYLAGVPAGPGGGSIPRNTCSGGSLQRVLAGGLRSEKKPGFFDFYKGEFRKEKSLHEYRRRVLLLCIPLLLCCTLAGLYFGYEYRTMTVQQEDLRQQIVEVFRETLPPGTPVVQPVQQLQVMISEVKATYRTGGMDTARHSVIELLTEISVRIPPAYPVKVVRLVADTDALMLKGVTRDFNTVDAIQKELKKSPLFREAVINSANQGPPGDAVSFELKLVLTEK